MTTFVLVHGAWHGPSAWDRLVPLLQRGGARTRTPELGLDADAGLRTHARQIADALDAAAGDDTVLVGHSYAGLVVRQAADLRPDRVRHLVLVDGWAGGNGVGMFNLASDSFVRAIRAAAQAGADGQLIPPPPPAAFGVTEPADAGWLASRLRPQPLRSFTEATELTGAVDRIPGTAICCQPLTYPFDRFAAELGYRTLFLDGSHDIMVTAPQALADLLLGVSQSFESEKAAH
jgi:pimeloyl-ACP methyl ester carboxylesterase